MLRDIWQRFTEYIAPIKGAIMMAIIALISAFITYFGYDFLESKLPSGLLVQVTGLLGIFIFLILSFIFAAFQRILEGEEIEVRQFTKTTFDATKKNTSICLPIRNRNKYKDILCYAILEKFKPVDQKPWIYEYGELTPKGILSYMNFSETLLNSTTIPTLRWKEGNYGNSNCEIAIPPQQERNIEITVFTGRLSLQFCKEEEHKSLPLGIYEVKISINYKKNGGEIRKKYFEGYIYADIEGNKGKYLVGSGSWKKNKEIPAPRAYS